MNIALGKKNIFEAIRRASSERMLEVSNVL